MSVTKTLVAALAAGALLANPARSFAQTSPAQPQTSAQAAPEQSPSQAASTQASSQTPVNATQPPSSSQGTVPLTPEQLEQIRRAIQQPSVLGSLSRTPSQEDLPTFRAETVAPQVDFHSRLEEFMKGDLRNGPVRNATMTHQEFLAMVTPRELYGSGGISPMELLQGALVNWAVHAGVKQIQEWRAAREAAQIAAIRERINRELAALRGGR
jgi:hypothetical protein